MMNLLSWENQMLVMLTTFGICIFFMKVTEFIWYRDIYDISSNVPMAKRVLL